MRLRLRKSHANEHTIAPAPIAFAHRKTAPHKRTAQSDTLLLALITLVAALTRLWRIGRNNRVTWDESHFGRFGALYINRTFISDLHPPLAKLIVALAEHASGHNGTFDFRAGSEYPAYVDYTTMRVLIALFGIATPAVAYMTCVRLGVTRTGSALAAAFVIFDNAMCLMTRLILLDGICVLFTALALLALASLVRFSRHHEFSARWWQSLAATGAALGLAISSKWIGASVAALVGVQTLASLYCVYCRRDVWRMDAAHWGARALALIAVPVAIYLGVFRVHYALQTSRGAGDHEMPVRFQARLALNRFNVQPYDVPFGASVKLRPVNGLGLLYSERNADWSGHANRQRVFGHDDMLRGFDWWIAKHPLEESHNYTAGDIEGISHRRVITLVHDVSRTLLHAGSSLVSTVDLDKESSRDNHTSDSVHWIVEVASQVRAEDKRANIVHPLNTVFRLRNAASGCLLSATSHPLNSTRLDSVRSSMVRQHARERAQGKRRSLTGEVRVNEIVCVDEPQDGDDLWMVEINVDIRIGWYGDISSKIPRTFISDTISQNQLMATMNKRVVSNPDRYSPLESPAWSWPFLVYPMRMTTKWVDGWLKHYEIGNPLLWWTSSVLAIVVYPVRFCVLLVASRRRSRVFGALREYYARSWMLWLGWALHYFPFFLVGRATYLHHYLPALYFALLLLAAETDYQLSLRLAFSRVVVCIVVAVVAVFLMFAKCTYGWDGPVDEVRYLQWLPSWNILTDKNDI